MKNKLNNKQAKMLFTDILKGDVKRMGNYEIGDYNITIYLNKKTTNNQRVMAFYNRMKSKGLCVECGEKTDKYVRCLKCRTKRNNKRKKKNGRRTKRK